MIKDREFWNTWESQGPLREPLDYRSALALGEAMYEYARLLRVFPPADPLAGLATKISLARAVNVHSAPGTDRPRS